jgi:outer membrane receptor protein involved in Fe transport
MRRVTSRSLLFVVCVIFALGIAQFVLAQSSDTGGISGVAKDQTGAVIMGAEVVAVSPVNNFQDLAKTDSNGRYILDLLRPGRYSVTITAEGFGTIKHANVIVEVGRATRLDFLMKPPTLETVVVTTAETPVVETDRSEFSTNINQETMQSSPVNVRRWATFALTTPGASTDGTFGLTSFRGISGLLNNTTVDGADDNQAFFAEEKGRTRISYNISEDSIQEFQVTTSNYSAEYGRAAGGVINAVTKSGGNSFHGTAYWYYRDSAFGATNPFFLLPQTVNGTTTSVPVNPPDKRHQFGGSFGGALIKDKLFYFFSADQQKRNFPGVATPSSPKDFFAPLSVPEISTLSGRGVTAAQANSAFAFLQSLTGTVPRRADELVLFPKIDWNVTPKNHTSFEYNRMRWSSPAGIQTGGVVNRGIESFGNDYVKTDTGIARWSSTLSSTLVNEALFNYGRDFEFENGQPSIAGEPVSQGGISPQITISGAAGFVFGKPNFLDRTAYPDERRVQVGDTVSWSRGKHLFKFGGDVNHVNDVFNNLFQGGGQYSYNTRVDFITDYSAYVANPASPAKLCPGGLSCYSSFIQGLGPAAFEFHTWDLAYFANDEWRIAPRLTLNFGLRWEYEKMPAAQIPNPALPLTAQLPSDKGDFGPRFGFAIDLGGSHRKTVLRGGYGVYFGRIINSTISNAIVDTAVIGAGTTTITNGVPRITGGTPLSQLSVTYTPTTAGAPAYPLLAVFPSTGATSAPINPPNVIEFAPDTKLPLVHEFDLAFEREIANNTAVSVSYLGSQGRRLPIFIDTNLALPTSTITYTVNGGSLNGQSFTLPLFTARSNLNFAAITQISDVTWSQYNGVVVGFNRRMSHGIQAQATYTYAHANDEGQSSTTFTATNNLANPYALAAEQARSIFDIRHRVAGSAIWQPDYFHNRGTLGRLLLDGFSFSPVVTAASGAPYSGFVSGNARSCTSTISVSCVPTGTFPAGVPACIGCTNIIGSGGSQRLPAIPRDTFTAPNTVNVDMRVAKKFWYRERANLELIMDMFNVLNRVNPTTLSGPLVGGASGTSQYIISGTTLNYQSTFGTPTSTSSTLGGPGQRQIQIGARLNW